MPVVRVGLFLAYWPWFSAEEQIELAKLADRAGLDSVWVAEAWGQDVVSVLGHLSAVTERIALGSGLLQIPARTPGDDRDDGRHARRALRRALPARPRRVGAAGVGGLARRVASRGRCARTREYVEIVRAALAREGAARVRGRGVPAAGARARGLGKPLKLLVKPVQERIPIYLGAIGPKSVEQTAKIADGWLPFMFSPEHRRELLAPFAGTDVDIAPVVMVCVDEDLDRARDLARPWLALYLGGMGAKGKNFYVETAERFGRRRLGPPRAGAVPGRRPRGRRAALSAELIDNSAICCRPAELDERLAEYERAGATTLLAMPFGDRPRIVRGAGRGRRAARRPPKPRGLAGGARSSSARTIWAVWLGSSAALEHGIASCGRPACRAPCRG